MQTPVGIEDKGNETFFLSIGGKFPLQVLGGVQRKRRKGISYIVPLLGRAKISMPRITISLDDPKMHSSSDIRNQLPTTVEDAWVALGELGYMIHACNRVELCI